jgi:hypothetical protein
MASSTALQMAMGSHPLVWKTNKYSFSRPNNTLQKLGNVLVGSVNIKLIWVIVIILVITFTNIAVGVVIDTTSNLDLKDGGLNPGTCLKD